MQRPQFPGGSSKEERLEALIVYLVERVDFHIEALADRLTHFERKIMATMDELQASLDAVNDQLVKASGEIQAEIKTLQDELAAAGQTSPGVDASVARLQAMAQALDDLNADVPPAP